MSTVTQIPANRARNIDRVAAAEVRALLARNGLRQEDLAAWLDMTQSQVSKRLRGVTPFTLQELALVGEAFNLTVGQLLGDATAPRNPDPEGLPIYRVHREGLEPSTRWLNNPRSETANESRLIPAA